MSKNIQKLTILNNFRANRSNKCSQQLPMPNVRQLKQKLPKITKKCVANVNVNTTIICTTEVVR